MKAVIDNWSVVVVGAWNTAILTTDWLTKQLGVAGPVQIEFSIANPSLPVRYTFQNVRMVVHDSRLILAPLASEQDVLVRMETFAKKILTTLEHTPVSGVGLNFDFVEDHPPDDLKNLFRLHDQAKIADADFVVEATELRRRLRQGQDASLNLNLRQQGGSAVTINLNFHRDVSGAAAAAKHLEGQVVKCHELALSFLRDAYDLEIEEAIQ